MFSTFKFCLAFKIPLPHSSIFNFVLLSQVVELGFLNLHTSMFPLVNEVTPKWTHIIEMSSRV